MHPRDLPVLARATPASLAIPMMPDEQTHPGLSIAQIASIIWAHRRQSLLIAFIVLLLGAAAAALWPRSYAATATLMVNFDVNDPLSGREFPTGLQGSYMSTQVELARGSEVLLAVVDRLKLSQIKKYAAGFPGGTADLRDWVATRVQKNLLIEQGRYGSQLLYITYTSDNALEAANIANTVADIYAEQQYRRLVGPASERAQRYTAQLAELKSKVDHAQEQVSDFRTRNHLVDADAKSNLDMALLSSLEQRLQDAQNARRAAEVRAASDAAVGGQVLNSPMIQGLKSQLAAQNARMAELRSTLGPRHPQVEELQSQIDSTHQALRSELQAYAGNASSELTSARQLESQLQKAVDEQRVRALAVRELQDEGAKYQLALDSAQAVYKRALDGYDQVMFASTGGYTNISFISRATPPPKPSKPKLRILMVLAALLGAALGIALPFAYELLNRRVRCRDDMERDHGVPVLAELGLDYAKPRSVLT